MPCPTRRSPKRRAAELIGLRRSAQNGLALFEKSGQTAAEFCRDNDLSPATLSFWLRQQAAPEPEEEPALVEVPLPRLNTAPAGAAVTIQLPSGLLMEITAGTDPKWLAQLLRVLVPAQA